MTVRERNSTVSMYGFCVSACRNSQSHQHPFEIFPFAMNTSYFQSIVCSGKMVESNNEDNFLGTYV